MFRTGLPFCTVPRAPIHRVCFRVNDAPKAQFVESNINNGPGVVQLSSPLLVVIQDKNKSLKSSQGLGVGEGVTGQIVGKCVCGDS